MKKEAVKFVSDELLNEAFRIQKMVNDGKRIDPQFIIDLLIKTGNELRDELYNR